MSLLPFFGNKNSKNRYSERKSAPLSRNTAASNTRSAMLSGSPKPAKAFKADKPTLAGGGSKLNAKSMLGFFSAATLVTVCAGLFVAVAIGLIFVYRWSTNSDFFALSNIDVHGLNNLSYTEVLAQAEVQAGQNSLALSLDSLEANLLKNPWIAEVSVKRSLPDGLLITINERKPNYWTLNNGHMYYADSCGNLIAGVNSNKFLALPILEIAPDSGNYGKNLENTVGKLAGVLAGLPQDYQLPALYRVTQARGMEVHFENKPLRLLLGLEDIDGNIRHMNLVLSDLSNRGELGIAKEVRAHNGKVWVVINGT